MSTWCWWLPHLFPERPGRAARAWGRRRGVRGRALSGAMSAYTDVGLAERRARARLRAVGEPGQNAEHVVTRGLLLGDPVTRLSVACLTLHQGTRRQRRDQLIGRLESSGVQARMTCTPVHLTAPRRWLASRFTSTASHCQTAFPAATSCYRRCAAKLERRVARGLAVGSHVNP